MLPVLLLGWILRLIGIGGRALWWDEGYSLYFSTLPLPETTARTAADIHPPLYYYMLAGWMALFGTGDVAARLLSATFSTLSIALVYALGARLWNRRAGLLAALLMSIAPFQVFYAQEARMYAAVGFFALISAYTFLRWFARHDNKHRYVEIGYVVASAAMIFTQYYAAFLLPAQTIWVLLRRRSRFWQWLPLPLVVTALNLPWLIYAYFTLSSYVASKVAFEGYSPLNPLSFVLSCLSAFVAGSFRPDNTGIYALMAAPPLALAAVGAGSRWLGNQDSISNVIEGTQEKAGRQGTGEKDAITYLLLHLFVPILCGYLINLRYPFTPVNWERLFLMASPALVLLAARGLLTLAERWRVVAIVAAILLASGSSLGLAAEYVVPRYPLDDYRPVINEVAMYGQPRDVVLCVYPWQVGYFKSYFPDDAHRPLLYEVPTERWKDPAAMDTDLTALLATHPRVWLPAQQSFGRILESDIERRMAKLAFPITNSWYGNVRMLSYASPAFPGWVTDTAAQPQTITPQSPVSFDDIIALRSYSLTGTPVPSGVGAVQIELDWQLLKQTGTRYQISLRLTDAAGRTWAQRDSEPVAGLEPFTIWKAMEERADRHALQIPTGVPPGEYTVRVGIRDASTGTALNVLDQNKSRKGIEYDLGNITVTRTPANVVLNPESIIMQERLDPPANGGITLLGYSADQGELKPGETLRLSLYWQVRAKPNAGARLLLELLDSNNKIVGSSEREPLAGRYPPSEWHTGEYIWDQEEFAIPATASAGRYHLHVKLLGSDANDATIAAIQIGEKKVAQAPTPQHPVQYRFGDRIELVGYDLSTGTVGAGEKLKLTLYWHALGTPEKNYKVTAQLLDNQMKVRGQRDAMPCDGQCPTQGWAAQEYYPDTYEFGPEQGTPPGEYIFGLAMYDESAPAPNRLPIVDAAGKPAGDFVVLGKITVK